MQNVSVLTVSAIISTTLHAAVARGFPIIWNTPPKRRAWRNLKRRTVILSICFTARRKNNILVYKVYNDGGAFIGIRKKIGSSSGGRKSTAPEELIVVDAGNGDLIVPAHDERYENMIDNAVCGGESQKDYLLCANERNKSATRVTTRSAEFKRYYIQSMGMKWLPRREFIAGKMYKYFKDETELYSYLNRKMRNAYRAEETRRRRCVRRASLHGLDLFCTFTYDDKKMTEKQFRTRLLNTLRHFASRKGWKYMGAWERGDEGRLHFHALMRIPEGTMSGRLEFRREYNPVRGRVEENYVNTFFEKTFGRNTFERVDGTALSYVTAVNYIVKYIVKEGGRMICSRGLSTFFETTIDVEDILCRLHPTEIYDDRKYILFDDFKVWDRNGKYLGTFNRSLLPYLKLVN